jgi:hypothetical protein
MSIVLIVGASALWVGQAIVLSRLMNRRGFHPLPWFVVPIVIGPPGWLVALLRSLSGPPLPEVVRRGRRGTGSLDVFDVFVLLERDELPSQTNAKLARLMPYCHRLVLARVLRADGHAHIKKGAEAFLHQIARDMGSKDAELQIRFGNIRRAAQEVHGESDFGGLILRSDQPDELFDNEGEIQKMTCLPDGTTAWLFPR